MLQTSKQSSKVIRLPQKKSLCNKTWSNPSQYMAPNWSNLIRAMINPVPSWFKPRVIHYYSPNIHNPVLLLVLVRGPCSSVTTLLPRCGYGTHQTFLRKLYQQDCERSCIDHRKSKSLMLPSSDKWRCCTANTREKSLTISNQNYVSLHLQLRCCKWGKLGPQWWVKGRETWALEIPVGQKIDQQIFVAALKKKP